MDRGEEERVLEREMERVKELERELEEEEKKPFDIDAID